MILKLRKNASQKAIRAAIAELKDRWEQDYANAPILFYEGDYPYKETPGTYYLSLGGVIRWGYRFGHFAWGFNQRHVDYEIACQEAAQEAAR